MRSILPWSMRRPRQAYPQHAGNGWFYINPGSIDVVASTGDGNNTIVKLTRKQLETALFVMDEERKNRP